MGDWRLGSYELLRRLGEGGMAQVYLARDIRLGREVAVKVLDPKLADRPGFRERFMREARVAAALDHPNIVPLFDFGDTEALYLVMPYVSGGSLQDMLPQTPLPIGEVVTYGSQIADALEYAHQRKVVHRDVKPANMLVHADGRLMLSDFGLAKIVNVTQKLVTPRNRPDAGTPEYMAPEQVTGNSDGRSDIYGLGVVLYLLLTGRLPFSGSSSQEVMQAHLYKEPAPLRRYNPSVPAAMEAVVMRAMAKRPSDRFQRASELGAALLSALIADHGDAPTFVIGSPSHGNSRPTGHMPIAAPQPQAPELMGEAPPWRRVTDGPAMRADAGASSGQTSSATEAASAPTTSEWGEQHSSSSLNGILPNLNMPFTSLDSPEGASASNQESGAGSAGQFSSFGSQGARSGYSGAGNADSLASGIGGSVSGFTDSQTTGSVFGVSSARTMGRMPFGPPAYPPASPSAYPPSPSSGAGAPYDAQRMRAPQQPPFQPTPAAPMMAPGYGVPGYGASMATETPAPAQPADLRAALPGSRTTEPPPVAETRQRHSLLWVVITLLLIIMVIAVIVLLRGLEAGPAGGITSLPLF